MRSQMSDQEAWECLVGGVTVQEFVAPFDGDLEAAIARLFETWPFDEPIPDWLEESIRRYCAENRD